MDEPKSCVLLPEAKLLILDAKMGLTLMDLPTKETKRQVFKRTSTNTKNLSNQSKLTGAVWQTTGATSNMLAT